ncbi:Hint domain-containing protein [Roseovarius aquimarinus]|uniref:Hint domain-containing protein n=1 Tax=Roseovarius aquimarinus TaxID=1229156 RepID=A0ABW7ICF9_9RHOB
MVYTPSAQSLAQNLRAATGEPNEARARSLEPPRPGARAPESAPARLRECEVAYLRRDARIAWIGARVPAHPVFDAAFSAFARGTLITTTRGPVAVEDLDPGMSVVTQERGPSPILWIGRMTWPGGRDAGAGAPTARLTRVQSGAFGLERPMTDLVTGPGARTLQRGEGRSGSGGADLVLRPVHDMIDGTHVIALSPPGDIELFHIALRRHATITAGGLDFETYHPGPGFETQLTYQQLAQFTGLFPHVMRPADFGALAHPRAALGDMRRAIT